MKPTISLAVAMTFTLAGCISNPGRLAQDKYDKTQTTEQASLPDPCGPGEVRTYRPTPKTDRPTYDSAIPPTSDVSTRLPSECRRRR